MLVKGGEIYFISEDLVGESALFAVLRNEIDWQFAQVCSVAQQRVCYCQYKKQYANEVNYYNIPIALHHLDIHAWTCRCIIKLVKQSLRSYTPINCSNAYSTKNPGRDYLYNKQKGTFNNLFFTYMITHDEG